MKKQILVLIALVAGSILAAGCLGGANPATPTPEPLSAGEVNRQDVPAAAETSAEPNALPGAADPVEPQGAGDALQPPTDFINEYKLYRFAFSGDAGFNERWFFQSKSGGGEVDANRFEGSVCIQPGETLSVNRSWGQQVGNEWTAFEGEPWKTVDGLEGRGVGAAASKLREAAALGGLDTVEMTGKPGEEKIVLEGARAQVPGVSEIYWSSLYACDCEQQLDLWIVNPGSATACVHWRVLKEELVLWVAGN